MPRTPGFRDVPCWFAVLADHDSAGGAANPLRDHAPRQVTHPSGRPWLLGRWPDTAIATGQAGLVKLAVIGQHAITDTDLARAALRIRLVGDVDQLASSLPGSFHLIASLAGEVRVQGTITGVRRVFHARLADWTVAADRADVLAWLLGTGLDPQRLAVHLLDPPILYPLAGQPVWQGVRLLPTDHYLVLDRGGRERSVRWWTPPEPVVTMREGARALRETLSEAVDARVRGQPLVSADLGGVDSTAVCCMAASTGVKVVAYTAASQDPHADDVLWASRTVAGLGNIEHHVVPADEMPLVYDGVLSASDQFDEPCAVAVDRNRWMVIGRRAASRGSRVHLTGFGGDELLYGSLAHLHTLLRTDPRLALRNLRGFVTKYRWPRTEAMRQLLDTRPYRIWLREIADDMGSGPAPPEEPLLAWGFEPRLPPWATPDAVGAVRDLVRAEAATAEPLSMHRGQHRELETMRFVSRITRQVDQMAGRIGMALAAPYYDTRVVEAGLAVRPSERISPWRYKPLIVAAMRGIVPEESLVRETKANGTCDEDTGLRRHRNAVLALCEDSRLGELGLIDAGLLHEACSRPIPPDLQIGVLYQTIACEVWLRTLERSPILT